MEKQRSQDSQNNSEKKNKVGKATIPDVKKNIKVLKQFSIVKWTQTSIVKKRV